MTAGTWSRILMVSLVRQQSARSSVRTASHLNVKIITVWWWYSDLVTWPADGTGCGTLAGAGRRSAAWAGLPPDPFKHKIIKSFKIYTAVLNESLRNFVSEHLAYFCVAFCLLNSFVKIFMFTDRQPPAPASVWSLLCEKWAKSATMRFINCNQGQCSEKKWGSGSAIFSEPKRLMLRFMSDYVLLFNGARTDSDWLAMRSHLSICKQTNDGW